MRSLIRRLEENVPFNSDEIDVVWKMFDRQIGDRSAFLYVYQHNWRREKVGEKWFSFNDPKERAAVEGLKIVDRKEVQEPGYKRLRKYVLVDYGPPSHAPYLDAGHQDSRLSTGIDDESKRDFWEARKGIRAPEIQTFADDLYREVGLKPGVVIDVGVFGAFHMHMAWVRSPRQKSKEPFPKFFAMCLVYVADADEAQWHGLDGMMRTFRFDYHMANRGEFSWWTTSRIGKEIIAKYEKMRKIDAKRADEMWKKYGADRPEPKK